MVRWSAIIPAAGSGERLGSKIPKPFIRIGDKTILEHTAANFLDAPGLLQLIVSSSAENIYRVYKIFESINTPIQLEVVEGGDTRQSSIYNALQKVAPEAELVAVHDAVRPFIDVVQIRNCCQVAKKVGGAVLGVPAKDTIKKIKPDNCIESTPDRSYLWQAQTPQVFRKELLLKAYNSAVQDDFIGTDDASLVERIGGTVKMVEGKRQNLKITYPIDLKIAELILGGRDEVG